MDDVRRSLLRCWRHVMVATLAAASMAFMSGAMGQPRFRVEVLINQDCPMGRDCETVAEATEVIGSTGRLPGRQVTYVYFLDPRGLDDVNEAVVRSWAETTNIVFEPRPPVAGHHLRGLQRMLQAAQAGRGGSAPGGGGPRRVTSAAPPKPPLSADECQGVMARLDGDPHRSGRVQGAAPAPKRRRKQQARPGSFSSSSSSSSSACAAGPASVRPAGVSVPSLSVPSSSPVAPDIPRFLDMAIDLGTRQLAGTLTPAYIQQVLDATPQKDMFIAWLQSWDGSAEGLLRALRW